MGRTVVTSVRVDEDLWKELRIQAIKEGRTVQELLNEAIKKELTSKERRS